ncbi:SGNH/GDSL hydrolase family protein [Polaribacter staleyi]|uniref:SGNH/GDSL hydrolase family protein n=1 Tax=Polaribacter staleyi TaxID=2022337 RepID=UPI0031B9B53D
MKNSFQRFILLIALIYSTYTISQEIPVYKNGDNVVLIGDSITHGGLYHAFLQFFNATQFPNQKVNYFNGGISGDDGSGTLLRLEKDILIHNPNHAIIMLGMNDVRAHLFPKDFKKVDDKMLKDRKAVLEKYIANMSAIASKLNERGVSIIFMTPSIYDQTVKIKGTNNVERKNDGLVVFADEIKKLAEKYNSPLVDLNAVMLKANKQVQKKDKTATIIGVDRTHPGELGHLIMAYELIKTVFPVKYTSRVEIDVKAKKVITSYNCEVNLIDGTKEFTVFENALPFALQENLAPALGLIKDRKEYTQEFFLFKNLRAGVYQLVIDGIEVGTYNSKKLKKGIDLSLNAKTPQYKQAQKVYDWCLGYKKTNEKLRTLALMEFRTLRDYLGDDTMESKKAFLEKKMNLSEGNLGIRMV